MTLSAWKKDGFEISTDRSRLDRTLILAELGQSYWAKDNSAEVIWRSVQNSRCYGLYEAGGAQVGFARMVTDLARFAWISDVFVIDAHKGQGLGTWLMETIVADPQLGSVDRFMLRTLDAHGLYQKVGFERVETDPNLTMHLMRPKR